MQSAGKRWLRLDVHEQRLGAESSLIEEPAAAAEGSWRRGATLEAEVHVMPRVRARRLRDYQGLAVKPLENPWSNAASGTLETVEASSSVSLHLVLSWLMTPFRL